jgi:transposase, IS5 family
LPNVCKPIAARTRRVTTAIKRETKRRAVIEPVIAHIKNEHRMDRNYLAHSKGDAIRPSYRRRGP